MTHEPFVPDNTSHDFAKRECTVHDPKHGNCSCPPAYRIPVTFAGATPAGLQHMRKLFEETIANAERQIKKIDEVRAANELNTEARFRYWSPSHQQLVENALDALETQEHDRIKAMNEGIAEIDGAQVTS